MKIVLKHILRNIKENKGKSLLIILSLAIASALFIINITLPEHIISSLIESIRIENGSSDLEVSNRDLFNIEELKTNNEDIIYTPVTYTEGTYNDTLFLIGGYDIETSKEMKLLGNDVPNLNKNEVVINDYYAKEHNYHEGDTIKLNIDSQTYELKLVKIVSRKGATYKTENEPYFIANLETIAEINKTDKDKYNTILIDVKDDTKIDEYSEYLKNNNADIFTYKLVDIDELNEEVSYVSYMMTLIAVISIIMIYFVISSLNRIIISERMPVIGTFRSIGATKEKMNSILLLENAIYGLIGGVIGSSLSIIFVDKLIPLFAYIPNPESISSVSKFSFSSFLIGTIFTIILEVIISLQAILKTNKRTIKDIMFETESVRYEVNKKHSIVGILLFIISIELNILNSNSQFILSVISIVLFLIGISNIIPLILELISIMSSYISKKLNLTSSILASKNISHNKMNVSSSKLIVISLSCAMAILTISSSLDRTFESFKYNNDYDILVSGVTKKAEDYDNLYNIEEIEKIDYLYYYYDLEPTFNGKNFNTNPIILGVNKDEPFIKNSDYSLSSLKGNELIIDEVYAKKNNISKGDLITLNLGFIGFKKDFKVVGYMNSVDFSTSRNCILINQDTFIKNITDIPVRLNIKTKEETDLIKLKDSIEKELAENSINTMTYDEFIAIQAEATSETMSLVYAIVGMAVILSFVGVINNQIIGFLKRKKELAILNSTCMSKNQITRLLISETLLINFTSCLISLIVGFLMTNILSKALESMSLFIEMNFNLILSIKFITIVFIILLMTLIVPIKRLKNMKVIDEIKYE